MKSPEEAARLGRLYSLELAENVVGGEWLGLTFHTEMSKEQRDAAFSLATRVQIELRKLKSKETGVDENARTQAELDGAVAVHEQGKGGDTPKETT